MVLEKGRAELNRLPCSQMNYLCVVTAVSHGKKQLASAVSEEVKGSCGAH